MDRFILPVHKDKDLWEMYKKAEASFWTTEEIDLVPDRTDWESKMNEKERHLILMILAFFASADGIVGENLVMNFYQEVPFIEAKYFYGFQIMMENIHAETYSLLIETYVRDPKEQHRIFHAAETCQSIKEKAKWAFKYMYPQDQTPLKNPAVVVVEETVSNDFARRERTLFLKRLVAFACIEGIFFSGSFCAIFWMKKRGLLPGLCFSNELISRDEGLHCDFACVLYHKIAGIEPVTTLDDSIIAQIISDAVAIEETFIKESIPVELIGMNSKLMMEYIRFVAHRLFTQLVPHPKVKTMGFPDAKNPFEWMDMISLQGKTNFFEKRVGEYSKANFHDKKDMDEQQFSLDEEF